MIYLTDPDQELSTQEVRRRLSEFTCRGCRNKSNCFMKCMPQDSTGKLDFDALIDLVKTCKNICNGKNVEETDEFLLAKVKESIIDTIPYTKNHNKNKKAKNSSSAVQTSSCNMNYNSFHHEACQHEVFQNDIGCIPCFKSKATVEEKDESGLDFKFKMNFLLPSNLVNNNSSSYTTSLHFPSTDICRYCFAFLYGFTMHGVKKASQTLKINRDATAFFKKSFRDATLHPYNHAETEIIYSHNLVHEQFNSGDRPYDDGMISNSLLPLSDIDLALWLEDCFLTYGDSAPNRNINQVSSTFKKDIWSLYVKEMSNVNKIPVDESRFNEIWLACFPNYLVRPYANVIGKCDTCYKIDYQRRAATDKATKEALRQAHLMHRGGLFMPERRR